MKTEMPSDADGNVLRGLETSGNDLSKPMVVDFQIAASDEETAKRVAEAAGNLGYQTSIYFDDEEADLEDDEDLWTCECSKTMVATYDAIMAAQAELDAIARPLGAYCDGWGTFGNADETE